VTELVPTGTPLDDDRLRQRLRELEDALEARSKEVSRVKTELAEFRLRYRREVGQLSDELEDLERAIAELEVGEFSKRPRGRAGHWLQGGA
jgi:predicted RNase H-like nuclease (RuvC/YqgF family)